MTKKNEKPIEEKVEPEENTELSNLENQLKRALADYQNLEKRIASEKSSWILASNKNLLLRLLPGLDSLLLAEKHTQDEGVKLSIKHFIDSLEAEGVKKIETVGRTFDPNLMEAITTQEGEEGKILEEVRAGYMLYDSVLRPAQVIVGKSATS
ncbi:MAG TPA: nucleotide exchange factor GrpE [Patescibacteria group bacterium]|jgi:molecular chaperone GrpE|nr:nucleotide exchange factor GrpE [Patescibacteria group bacterium]